LQDGNYVIFIAYAPPDMKLVQQIEQDLQAAQKRGLEISLYNIMIGPGMEFESENEKHLSTADIILLMTSRDFLWDNYSRSQQVEEAIRRHDNSEARVIPVILRPCEWDQTNFAKLQPLPDNRKPLTKWSNRDEAFVNISKGVQDAVRYLKEHPLIPAQLLDTSPEELSQKGKIIPLMLKSSPQDTAS
jgi:hypothetical protein